MKSHPIEQAAAIVRELPLIQERLFRVGLLKTAHAMDAAVKSSGYELADMITGKRSLVQSRIGK